MTDANGLSPLDDDFYHLDGKTWIEIGHREAGWIYQKIADGQPTVIVLASPSRINAPTYAQFAEARDGRPYAELCAMFRKGVVV